jgi:hypothetical protein
LNRSQTAPNTRATISIDPLRISTVSFEFDLVLSAKMKIPRRERIPTIENKKSNKVISFFDTVNSFFSFCKA